MLVSLCRGWRTCCFRASIVEVCWLPLMSCNWLLVASCIRAMLIALSRVKVESCSSRFDWTRGLFDPKIRASMMHSSGLVHLHSVTRIRTFLRNESMALPGSCFRVQSLYRASLKLLNGATYPADYSQYLLSFFHVSADSDHVDSSLIPSSPDQIRR